MSGAHKQVLNCYTTRVLRNESDASVAKAISNVVSSYHQPDSYPRRIELLYARQRNYLINGIRVEH